MREVIGENFREFNKPGSMGVVNDTRYIRCFWPPLDEPTALFAKGSSGIEVQGPPTPRNVVFPEDTLALNIAVNEALLGDIPRWRATDIPTKVDCYFTRAMEQKEVDVEKKHVKTLEVEPGIFAEVDYSKTETETKAVNVETHLTTKQAREMATVVKADAIVKLEGKR